MYSNLTATLHISTTVIRLFFILESGVGIKTSRFNHSCEPNAQVVSESEVRAISDIKSGEEITISYQTELFGMKNRENRQEILEFMGFVCSCDLCKQQKENGLHPNQTKMDELIEDIEDLNKDLITVIKTLDELKEGIIYCYIF